MTRDEALAALHQLAREGWLRGVQVFGTDACCTHGEHADCESTGYGLCDTQNSLSDCNRAARWLMRPHDDLVVDDLAATLAEQTIGWPS